VTYRFSTSAAEADRLRFKLRLDMPGDVSRADLEGALVAKATDVRWRIGFEGAGGFSGRIGDAGLPWPANATGSADAQGLHASALDVRLGDDEAALSASGEAEARFGGSASAHLDLASRQLDLDRFQSKFDLAALLRGTKSARSPS
jgi:hypothetical protein